MATATPRLALRIESIRQEAQDILAFRLVAADGGALLPFTPGAHVRGIRFSLWVLARNQDRLAFPSRLNDLPAGCVHVHLSETDGRLDLAQVLQGGEPDRHAYVCGPRALIGAASAAGRAPTTVLPLSMVGLTS